MSTEAPPELRELLRTPFGFEIVDPDRRKSPEAVAARTAGRVAHTTDPANPQLFANGGANREDAVLEAADPNRLFNGRPPNLSIEHEKPEHRVFVLLKAKMFSNREIAAKTGYSEGWISQITRQPWFRLALTRHLHDAGVDELHAFLEAEALPSLETLREIRDDRTAPHAVRKAAASDLADRFLGKATQRTEVFDGGKVPSLEEREALDREIALAQDEIKRLQGSPTAAEAATVS